MDFALTAEQEQLREVARRFLAEPAPDGPDRAAHAARLGWLDPDLGMVERALLVEECGYALDPNPWWTRLALPDPLATAVGTASVAIVEDAVMARHDGSNRWLVSGEAAAVPDATTAERLVVATVPPGSGRLTSGSAPLRPRAADEADLFLVDPAAPGCVISPGDGIDPLRQPAAVTLRDTPADPLPDSPRALQTVRLRRRALLVAEAVGVAQKAYDLAVAHVKVREQFGRPVGSYQGVAFGIADCYVRVELARSLAYRAAWLIGAGDPAAGLAVATAVPAARHAAVANCEQAIQALGGLGMTWEHPLHRWYRRALWFEAYEMTTGACLDTVADALLAG